MSILDRTLSTLGRVGITAGALLLGFAGFQLWGTGLSEARSQQRLEAGFAARLAEPDSDNPGQPTIDPNTQAGPAGAGPAGGDGAAKPAPEPLRVDVEPTVAARADTADRLVDPAGVRGRPTAAAASGPVPALAAPTAEDGAAIATIDIPAIGLHKTVVEGTSREALRSGPGHYRSTPRPGRAGNAAIAGHRTTHGAPFFDLDQLQPGDEIVVETVEGRFSYLVEGHDDGAGGEVGHLIVEPDDVSVIADRGDNRLTLTACHPTYSARQRIVVSAVLHGLPVGVAPSIAEIRPAVATARAEAEAEVAGAVSATGTGPFSHGDTEPSTTAEASIDTGGGSDAGAGTIDSGLGWQTEHAGITLRWAAFTALIAGMAQLAARLWRRWPAYAVASPAFGLALFTCFTHLDRLIPAA